MSYKKFISALESEGLIDWCQLNFGTERHEGYYLPSSPDYYIASGLISNSYISHATALNIWGMKEAEPDKIYINREQSNTLSKSGKGKLVQKAVDGVFKGQQRQSASVSIFNGKEVILVKGKFTDQLGVIDLDLKGREQVRITDLERTLIDCVVRPAYATGPKEMVTIFNKARNLISVSTLAEYLDELDYTYPYHQSIGFYLEKAGNYPASELEIFQSKLSDYDFYLDYGMDSPAYSEKWKLYVPLYLK